MQFTYIKTPLHRYTFRSKAIKQWVEAHVEGVVLNLFCGPTLLSVPEVRNDLDESMPADYHVDALQFVETWKGELFGTVLLDPPYSYRKSMELYNGKVTSPLNALKDAIMKVLSPNGVVITFGYQSVSMGRLRGFIQEHLLVMSHGGAIHDTIAAIERRTG
jgi:hypothetical protein